MRENNSRRRVRPAVLAGAHLYLALLLTLFAVCMTRDAYGQTPSHTHPVSDHQQLRSNEAMTIAIPDIKLTDQDGRELSLYRDLMKDKLVVLNLFYTSCNGVCPTAGLWFSRIQDRLGERLGREVVLISISINPDVDTPEKVNQWASRWRRKPGWTLLTSKEKDARDLVKQFLAYEAIGTHSPVVFVGDGARASIEWVRVDVLNEGRTLSDFLEKGKDR